MPANVLKPKNAPCPVRVTVYDVDSDDDAAPVHDKTGDHNDREFRDWITNTMWWAVRNNKEIIVSAL